jgi:hypothetical protein
VAKVQFDVDGKAVVAKGVTVEIGAVPVVPPVDGEPTAEEASAKRPRRQLDLETGAQPRG